MQYLVMFTQYHEYWVEADSEEEAEKKGYELFCTEQRVSIANTHYDEVTVESQEDKDAD